jgi:thioredoxin-related protein
MKYIPKSILAILFCAVIFDSCADKQDFDQLDNLDIIPTAEASILYVETPEYIINQLNGVNFYSQTFNFDAFNEDFVADNVLDGVITYEVENTTSKPLDITFEFLDEAGNSLDSENFMVNAAPTAILTREIAYGPAGRSLDIIRNTSAIRVSATNLGDNTSISSLPNPSIFLRSSAKFRIQLK